MDKKAAIRLLGFHSVNRKSKTRTELRRSIKNPKFGALVGAMLVALSFAAEAQPVGKAVRIGYLGNLRYNVGEKEFLEELRKRGWIEGQNLVIDLRYWEHSVDRLRAQAAELVRLKVDVIVTNSGTAAQAVKHETFIIPIVMVGSADAVNQGLAISLARPGGNVTGLTSITPVVAGKQLELLKETFPKVSRVAVLRCGGSRSGLSGPGMSRAHWNEVQDAARDQNINLLPVVLKDGTGGIESALGAVMREGADALLASDCVRVPAAEIIALGMKCRLPAIYPLSHYVVKGGLMSYGADRRQSYRRAAQFVDKILNGAKPGDLPIEQPTKFELVVNLGTARTLGLTIPSKVLMWADRVIE